MNDNDKEELLRDHVESEQGIHSDEPTQDTTTVMHSEAAESSQEVSSMPSVSQTTEGNTSMNHTPLVANAKPYEQSNTTSSPGVLVLQWLTYAFWGWTAVALSWLAIVSVNYFINGRQEYESSGTAVAYALAATIVLFLIAMVCDMFYAKREPLHKTGVASVIMIIHAVIFALFGIGWLILAVFGLVRLIIGPENGYVVNDASTTLIVVGFIMSVVYAASLLRTLRMVQKRLIPYLYWGVMGLITATLIGLGVGGPAIYANSVKNDRLLEANLSSVSSAINSYAQKNEKLPSSLSDIRGNLNEASRTLLDRNLVEYKPGKEVPSLTDMTSNKQQTMNITWSSSLNRKTFEYQLCASFKSDKNTYGRYGPDEEALSGYRPSSPDVYNHKSGHICYDLQTRQGYSITQPAY